MRPSGITGVALGPGKGRTGIIRCLDGTGFPVPPHFRSAFSGYAEGKETHLGILKTAAAAEGWVKVEGFRYAVIRCQRPRGPAIEPFSCIRRNGGDLLPSQNPTLSPPFSPKSPRA